MELIDGCTAYSHMTFECSNKSCVYCESGRCVYNVSKIKVEQGRACYDELVQMRSEAQADYDEGMI